MKRTNLGQCLLSCFLAFSLTIGSPSAIATESLSWQSSSADQVKKRFHKFITAVIRTPQAYKKRHMLEEKLQRLLTYASQTMQGPEENREYLKQQATKLLGELEQTSDADLDDFARSMQQTLEGADLVLFFLMLGGMLFVLYLAGSKSHPKPASRYRR